MDPRLLKYYNRELQHIREMGAEFADEFPKIAGRLGLEQLECADPYVSAIYTALDGNRLSRLPGTGAVDGGCSVSSEPF